MIKVTVNINGMSYNLKGEKDEKYLLGVASYVDSRIKEIMSKKSGLSTNAATVLAAVNIADELYESDDQLDRIIKEKEEIEKERNLLKNNIEKYNEKLETVIKEKTSIEAQFGKKESELHERYKNQEVTYNELKEEINKLKLENEKLLKGNKEINEEFKKKKWNL